MDYTEANPMPAVQPPRSVVGEWYLKGFVDAYGAHQAVVPSGPAGEEYQKGYQEGLAAVQRDFFSALCA
ncbi:MAG: hypothetical protein ACM3MF_06960 [Anaerolineae bacterium]